MNKHTIICQPSKFSKKLNGFINAMNNGLAEMHNVKIFHQGLSHEIVFDMKPKKSN